MTELIWDGKYDTNGKKVTPPRIALPFQAIETVNDFEQLRADQFADLHVMAETLF